jgi:hypothetical protein
MIFRLGLVLLVLLLAVVNLGCSGLSIRKIRSALQRGVLLFAVALIPVVLSGCAGLVSGTSSGNPPPQLTLDITNVQAAPATTSTSQVVWTTNVPADSAVDYGTSTSYGSSTPVDSAMVTSHQVTLSGLAASTTYYYQVRSSDSKNNHGNSGGHTFKTSGFSIAGAISPAPGGGGATLALGGAASTTTTADSLGNYTFTGLANGTYTVAPSHAGFTFTPSSQSMTVNGANITGVNFTDTVQTFSLSGTISPTAGGSGATLTLSGAASATTTANSSGAYTFTGLASGSYSITPSNTGYTFTPVSQNATVSTVNVAGVNFADNAAAAAPTITTQPVNQRVTAGQTATFGVVAAGTVPLSYQWQKNGSNIPGATSSSYTTPVTMTSDSGSTFAVVISNTAGTVTSAAATLTVTPATLVSIAVTPANPSIAKGGTQQFTATGTFSDSTTQVLSNAVWASATPGVATSNATGLATGVGAGTSTISGTVGSITGSTLLTVTPATYLLNPSTTSLSFGNVNVGSSSSQNVTFTNSGNSSVAIVSVSIAAPGYNVSGLSTGQVIAPAQTATLIVTFAPSSSGSLPGSVSVASNATNSPAIVTFSGSGVASIPSLPTCGKLNDTNVYTPPNYDTFTPPAKGQSYTDPVFGCKITRVTDAIAMGWVEATHFYNTVTPFNANDSYLFLYGSAPIIVDLSGNVVVPESNMPATNSSIVVWDTTNPKIIYYTNGNQFIKGTITGTPPNATVSPAVLATFTQYSSVVIPGDMDISNDGLHIWLTSASDMGGNSYTADVFLVALNAGNGAATSASEVAVMPSVTYHKLQIVPNNGVSVEGNGRTIYNPNGTVYEVPGGGTNAHTDWGLDSSGKMVATSIWYAGTAQNGCPSGWGYSLLDLASNSVRICLNDGIQNVGNASHNSARDTQSGHWIVFSDDDSGTCPSSSYWCFNNPTSLSGWSLYAGEILIWDDAGNTVRLAHHRSRSDESYWAQTRASISRDGKYIVFDSNYNQSSTPSGANYTDVFVIGPLY